MEKILRAILATMTMFIFCLSLVYFLRFDGFWINLYFLANMVFGGTIMTIALGKLTNWGEA